jgi:hypothetical protein
MKGKVVGYATHLIEQQAVSKKTKARLKQKLVEIRQAFQLE